MSENYRVIYVHRQYLSVLSLIKKPKRLLHILKKSNLGNCNKEKGLVEITPPLCLPGNFSYIHKINSFIIAVYLKNILRKLNVINYLTWVVSTEQLDLLKLFPGNLSVLHCHDGLAYYPGVNKEKVLKKQDELERNVNYIFYASNYLYKNAKYSSKSYYVGHGFDPIFLKCGEYAIPKDLATIPKPIIGFHGIFNFHTDEKLLEYLFENHPNISFVFVGPFCSPKANYLKKYKNFYTLGQKEFKDLPGYIKGFDVAILPYTKSDMTTVCSPLKLYEYLASGVKIVSVNIPEVHVHRDYIKIANSNEEFSQLIVNSLSGTIAKSEQIAYAREHLWSKKVSYMSGIIKKDLAADRRI